MSIQDKTWHLYVGDSWLGTLTPTGADSDWHYAAFTPGDAWGNFKPWFIQAADAHKAGDDAAWNNVFSQLTVMGLALVADDGERYDNPTVVVDGSNAWFVV